MTMTEKEVHIRKDSLKSCFAIVTVYKEGYYSTNTCEDIAKVIGCVTLDDLGRYLHDEQSKDADFYEKFSVEFPDLRVRTFTKRFDSEWGFTEETANVSLDFIFDGNSHFDSGEASEFRQDFYNFIEENIRDQYHDEPHLMCGIAEVMIGWRTIGAVVVTPVKSTEKALYKTPNTEFVKSSKWGLEGV